MYIVHIDYYICSKCYLHNIVVNEGNNDVLSPDFFGQYTYGVHKILAILSLNIML